jgi:hypothetical protein
MLGVEIVCKNVRYLFVWPLGYDSHYDLDLFKWVKSLSPLTCLHQVTINPLGNITRKSWLTLPHIKICSE